MLKKLSIILILMFAVIVWAAPSVLGFSIFNLGHAVSVSTGLSAKLACSAKYVSEFDESLIINDLASYSPVARVVDLSYDDSEQKVTASLFGLATTSASYVDGIGCSLDLGTNSIKPSLQMPSLTKTNEAWPKGESVDSIAPLLQEKLDAIVRADNEKGYNTRAMVVVKDGQIVAESYSAGIDNTTKLLGWSMAKSATAIMLGNLELRGKVNRQQKGLFEQWHDDNRNEITLEQMLQMSSGLKFDETYAPGSDATHMLFTAESAAKVAITSEVEKTPGTFFSYSSGTTNLLSYYIHQILGAAAQADQNYFSEHILQPLAMLNTVFEMDTSGVFVGSSYLYASARDWARLGQLMLNKGELNGVRIVSQNWVEQAQKPNSSNNEKAYGYQFWLNSGDQSLRWPNLPEDAYAMMGNRQQSVMMIPSENLVFVRLGWTAGDYPMANNYRRLLDEINQ